MILSDRDIEEFMASGRLSIEPYNSRNLTPNGYDLTIAQVTAPAAALDVHEGEAVVPPQTWFAVSTLEYVKLGKEIAGKLWIRTSYARRGAISSFGMIDAGFEGTLTLSAYNSSHEELRIPIGDRFAQMVFMLLTSSAKEMYAERSGTYQGQRGVTLAKK